MRGRGKKIIAWVCEKDEGVRSTMIPSGFKGLFLIVEEDYSYNLGVSYASPKEIAQVKQEVKEGRR